MFHKFIQNKKKKEFVSMTMQAMYKSSDCQATFTIVLQCICLSLRKGGPIELKLERF